MTAATNGGEVPAGREGDETRRIKTAVKMETSGLASRTDKRIKRLYFYVGIAFTVLTAVFGAGVWYHSIAKTEDVATVQSRVDAQDRRVDAIEAHHQDDDRWRARMEKRGDWTHDAVLKLLIERRITPPPEPEEP